MCHGNPYYLFGVIVQKLEYLCGHAKYINIEQRKIRQLSIRIWSQPKKKEKKIKRGKVGFTESHGFPIPR